LLTVKEAASVFQIGTFQLHSSKPVLDQTSCVYPGHHEGIMLFTNVSWFKKELTTFAELHSPFAMKLSGKTPSGATIPAPTFTALAVNGEAAYWDDDLPPTSASTIDISPNAQMSAEKKGYLVFLTSKGLTESQDAEALGIMLKRL
jgi:hypothetical protein